MSGHSHYANIKSKKAAIDAKRGKSWTKLARGIIVAAKQGGSSDPDKNLALRYAIEAAKAGNMPKDTIERAAKKGAGELEGQSFEEIVYEGYGPAGVALMIDILTDNRHRTAPEIKKIFERRGGSLGATGSVAWIFQTKGYIQIEKSVIDEDRLMELVLEAGADDVRVDGGNWAVTCPTDSYEAVRKSLAAAGVAVAAAELTRVPSTTVALDITTAPKVLALLEELDDHDDVQHVSANFDIPDDVAAQLPE